jgi:hypothetical protein
MMLVLLEKELEDERKKISTTDEGRDIFVCQTERERRRKGRTGSAFLLVDGQVRVWAKGVPPRGPNRKRLARLPLDKVFGEWSVFNV